MKKSLVARGIIGAVASLLGVAAVGCGADVGDGAAGDSAEIGVAEQAITGGQSLEFSGSLKLDSSIKNSNGNANNLELVVGGIDLSGSNSVGARTIGVYDRQTDTFTQLKDTLNANVLLPANKGLVEPELHEIPGQPLHILIAGGRITIDSTASKDSYVLKLTKDVNGKIILNGATLQTVTDQMTTERVIGFKNLKQCGSTKLVAFGGVKDKAWEVVTGMATTDTSEVFSPDPNADGNYADSTWTNLQDGSGHDVLLREERGYPEVLDVDAANHDEFFIAGGLKSGTNAFASVDRITVNSSCVVQNAVNTSGSIYKAEIATAMPAAHARFASIAQQSTVNDFPSVGVNTTFDFVLAGGNGTTIANGTALPTDTLQFDPDGTTSCGGGCSTQGIWRTMGTSLAAGRLFPRFIADAATANVAKLVLGFEPQSGSEATNPHYDSSLLNTVFTGSTASVAAGTALGASRVGAFADLLNNGAGSTDEYVGFGSNYTAQTPSSSLTRPDSYPGDVISGF